MLPHTPCSVLHTSFLSTIPSCVPALFWECHQYLQSVCKQTITVLQARNLPSNTNMPPATWSSVQEIIEDLEPSCPSEIPSDNEEAPNLAESINLMTKELKHDNNKNGKAKAKEPNTFNGSDPHKLTSFLLLCNLHFCNNFIDLPSWYGSELLWAGFLQAGQLVHLHVYSPYTVWFHRPNCKCWRFHWQFEDVG